MQIVECTANFTRPSDTTAYTSGDLVANSTTNTLVSPLTFTIPYGRGLKLWRVAVERTNTAVTNASFRLHLYKDSPTVSNGDNAAWLSIRANYIGFVDIVGTAQAFSDAASASGIYVNNALFAPLVLVTDLDRTVYGLLEARAGYTPASAEVITVRLIGEAYI